MHRKRLNIYKTVEIFALPAYNYIKQLQIGGDKMTLEELKARRKELGMSMKQLARLAGVPFGTLQKIFAGQTTNPRYDTLLRIEKVLAPKQPSYVHDIRHPDEAARVQEAIPAYAYEPAEEEENEGYDGEPDKTLSPDEIVLAPEGGWYTVRDYRRLPDDFRVELIDGKFYKMDAPRPAHQAAITYFIFKIQSFLKKNKGPCHVFPSAFDVQLDMDDKTMVQPDIVVYCHKERLLYWGGFGAPDLVIEIMSPSSRRKDSYLKLHKYANAGVREYWLVDLESEQLLVYELDESLYSFPKLYSFLQTVPVGIWGGKLVMDLSELKEDIEPFKQPYAPQNT